MNTKTSLPTEEDFDPVGCDLDAQSAWREFGGLTLEQAKAKYEENSLGYQEDFMFMGGRAFAYYFPVIEDHLRSTSEGNYHGNEAWGLAHCLLFQFEVRNLHYVEHLAARVLDMAAFVLGRIQRFGPDVQEKKRVAKVWAKLVQHIKVVTAVRDRGKLSRPG